jgi:DNA repair protein RadC
MRYQALYEGRTELAPPPAAPATSCKPWLRVERDDAKYQACMKIAESIGPVDSSRKAFALLREALGTEDQEVFGAMYLDTHLLIRGLAETGRGEMDAVMAPIGPTLRLAVAEGAQAVLIWHVHPTLQTQPSEADIDVTRSFAEACKTLQLLLVDHIIIGGKSRYYSFSDAGHL